MNEDHVKYDYQLIQKFADRLYAEANGVVIHSTVVATMVGIIAFLGALPRQCCRAIVRPSKGRLPKQAPSRIAC
ncbi:MAG: hypothetical protein E6K34_17825 [Gammaproteobacteria bacterium]|nr:MAG: hypothetical protein E6K34_17825 [Gammaproteobacteria bacterium]